VVRIEISVIDINERFLCTLSSRVCERKIEIVKKRSEATTTTTTIDDDNDVRAELNK